MKEASFNSEDISVHAKFVSDDLSSSLQEIMVGLVESDKFEQKTKTNRSMWPNKEIIGATYDNSSESIKIDVQPSKITLKSDRIFDITRAHKLLCDLLSDSGISPPNLASFRMESFSIYPIKEGYEVTFDPTKTEEKSMVGYRHTFNDFIGNYAQTQDSVSVVIDGDGVPYDDAFAFVNSMFNSDLILFGSQSSQN